MVSFFIIFTSNLIFLLPHKYADNSLLCTQSHKAKGFVKYASSLGAKHFEKPPVQSFFKLILVRICSRTYI